MPAAYSPKKRLDVKAPKREETKRKWLNLSRKGLLVSAICRVGKREPL